MARPLRIGLLGLGTVGTAVAHALLDKDDVLARRVGAPLELRRILVSDPVKERSVDRSLLCFDPYDILGDPDIDLVVEVPAIGSSVRGDASASGRDTSALIRARVVDARNHQQMRFGGASQRLNRQLEGSELNEYCRLDARTTHVLDAAIQKFCLSARGCDRVLRVSRTIADMAGAPSISTDHVAEALQYRFNELSASG